MCFGHKSPITLANAEVLILLFQGWRYGSLDFQHKFTHRKSYKSCVRRRKWIRYRQYIATDSWARVSKYRGDICSTSAAHWCQGKSVVAAEGGRMVPPHISPAGCLRNTAESDCIFAQNYTLPFLTCVCSRVFVIFFRLRVFMLIHWRNLWWT